MAETKSTPRQCVLQALAHQQPEICPYSLELGLELRRRLASCTSDPAFGSDLERYLVGVGPSYPESNLRVDDTHYEDSFGVVWEDSFPGEIGMVRQPILGEPSLAGYTFPPTQVAGLFDDLPAQLAEHADRFTLWSLGFSLFERAWTLRGMEAFLMDMVERPAFADELLDRICEFNLALIEQACRHPIDGVRFGDDWGAQQGLIMGPHLWRRFIKPRFARMVAAVTGHGKASFLHSDGDVREIIPDLIDMGLTILNPVQPDVMDIYEIKREFGGDLTFCGGVSVQQLLPHGSTDQVRAEVRRLLRELGSGGGLIIAPTHSLGRDIPLANLAVLVQEFTRQTQDRPSIPGHGSAPARSIQ
jgi:uroporphyrinogen decarboxylase